MKARFFALAAVAAAGAFGATARANEQGFKLPPEVTPKLRAACESDVRRLCIDNDPTVAKVKQCVMSKFFSLGKKCQFEIAQAGLAP